MSEDVEVTNFGGIWVTTHTHNKEKPKYERLIVGSKQLVGKRVSSIFVNDREYFVSLFTDENIEWVRKYLIPQWSN